MAVTLHEKQRVCVNTDIHFEHRADSGKKYEVVLNERQFLNLDDYIRNHEIYSNISNYPLGRGVWLYHKKATTELINHHKKCFFSFYKEAWITYRDDIHFHIYDAFIYGRTHNNQHDEKHERRWRYRTRRRASLLSRHNKILPWSSRNANYENDKRPQLTNVSQGKSSNPRTRFRRRGRNMRLEFIAKLKRLKTTLTMSQVTKMTISNIVISVQLKRKLCLNKIPWSDYNIFHETELFPATLIRQWHPVHIALFHNGKVILTGLKSMNEFYNIMNALYAFLDSSHYFL